MARVGIPMTMIAGGPHCARMHTGAALSSQPSQALWSWPASKEHRACQSLSCFTIPAYPAALGELRPVEAGATQPRTMVGLMLGALAENLASDDKIYMAVIMV